MDPLVYFIQKNIIAHHIELAGVHYIFWRITFNIRPYFRFCFVNRLIVSISMPAGTFIFYTGGKAHRQNGNKYRDDPDGLNFFHNSSV
jgi:hypothetical protein